MRILVIFPNKIGDSIIVLQLLQRIKVYYKDSEISILANSGIKEIVELVPFVKEVIVKSSKSKHSIVNTIDTVLKLRKANKFDLCFCLANSFTAALISFFSGVKIRVGYKTDGRSWLLTHAYSPSKTILHGSESDQYLLESYEGKKVKAKPYFLSLPEISGSKRFKNKYLVFNPHSLGQTRTLPKWQAVSIIDNLQEKLEYDIFLVGAPSEKEYSEQIINELKSTDRICNFTGKTTLVELAYLLAGSEIMISTDTGSAHLANVLGVPVVVFFGAGDYRTTRPFHTEKLVVINKNLHCSPCKYNPCIYGEPRCLTEIGNDEIVEAVDSLIHP